MDDNKYVLDSDVFIQANRLYYAFDIAPLFWDSLVFHAQNGSVITIDRVKMELDRGQDDLSIWIKEYLLDAVHSTDEQEVIINYQHIMEWIQENDQYNETAKITFAQSADGWLIAFAKTYDCIVVTQEVSAPESKNKIKIPDICKQFQVLCIDTFEMLRALKIRFK